MLQGKIVMFFLFIRDIKVIMEGNLASQAEILLHSLHIQIQHILQGKRKCQVLLV